MFYRNSISYNVYNSGGNFLGSYNNWIFSNISKTINSSPSTLSLDVTTTDLDILEVGNSVEVVVKNSNNPNGILVYNGKIREVEYSLDSGQVDRSITVSGVVDDLKNRYYQNSSGYYQYDQSSVSVYTALVNILDRYDNYYPGQVKYDSTTLPNSGAISSTTISLKANSVTYLELIETVVKSLPSNYYWFISVDGYFYARAFSNTHDHAINFNHLVSFTRQKDFENLYNTLLLWGEDNTISVSTSDSSSISNYGRRDFQNRYRHFTTSSALSNFAQRKLDLMKEPQVNFSFTLSSANYNLESLEVGDTFVLVNYDTTTVRFITEVDYKVDYAEVDTSILRNYITRETLDVQNKTNNIDNKDAPVNY